MKFLKLTNFLTIFILILSILGFQCQQNQISAPNHQAQTTPQSQQQTQTTRSYRILAATNYRIYDPLLKPKGS